MVCTNLNFIESITRLAQMRKVISGTAYGFIGIAYGFYNDRIRDCTVPNYGLSACLTNRGSENMSNMCFLILIFHGNTTLIIREDVSNLEERDFTAKRNRSLKQRRRWTSKIGGASARIIVYCQLSRRPRLLILGAMAHPGPY